MESDPISGTCSGRTRLSGREATVGLHQGSLSRPRQESSAGLHPIRTRQPLHGPSPAHPAGGDMRPVTSIRDQRAAPRRKSGAKNRSSAPVVPHLHPSRPGPAHVVLPVQSFPGWAERGRIPGSTGTLRSWRFSKTAESSCEIPMHWGGSRSTDRTDLRIQSTPSASHRQSPDESGTTP